MPSAKTTRKQGFAPGVSGNPAGRPQGSRNKVTIAAQGLLDGQAQEITAKAVAMALSGDRVALRLCLERLLPTAKEQPLQFDLPPIATLEDILTAERAVMTGIGTGDLTPTQAGGLMAVLDSHRRTLEAVEMEKRLSALEAARGDQP